MTRSKRRQRVPERAAKVAIKNMAGSSKRIRVAGVVCLVLTCASGCALQNDSRPVGPEVLARVEEPVMLLDEGGFRMELLNEINDGHSLEVRARLSAATSWNPEQVAIRLSGLDQGEILHKKEVLVSSLIPSHLQSPVSASEGRIVSVEIPSEGVSDYQFELLWGVEAESVVASLTTTPQVNPDKANADNRIQVAAATSEAPVASSLPAPVVASTEAELEREFEQRASVGWEAASALGEESVSAPVQKADEHAELESRTVASSLSETERLNAAQLAEATSVTPGRRGSAMVPQASATLAQRARVSPSKEALAPELRIARSSLEKRYRCPDADSCMVSHELTVTLTNEGYLLAQNIELGVGYIPVGEYQAGAAKQVVPKDEQRLPLTGVTVASGEQKTLSLALEVELTEAQDASLVPVARVVSSK